MGVRVDGEPASSLHCESQQAFGRVEALGAAVDLDRLVETLGGGEDDLGVEIGRRAASLYGGHATRDVTEDVVLRVRERREVAACITPDLLAPIGWVLSYLAVTTI